MPFKTVYHSDFYKIEVDLEGDLIRSEWLRHVSEEELKAGATALYNALSDYKIERAVANAQVLGSFSTSAKDWLAFEFYEMLSQTNIKRLARVMPSSVFHQVALESVITRAEAVGKARFAVRNFSNQDEAEKWLFAAPVVSKASQQ